MAIPLCEACHDKTAKYICQRCGALVCELHYNPYYLLCTKCIEEKRIMPHKVEKEIHPIKNIFALEMAWIIGILLIFVGFIFLIGLGFEGGAGIIIFPIPFIIPLDPWLGLIILVIIIFLFFLLILYMIRSTLKI